MSPLDYIYSSLDCKIKQLTEEDVMAQYLLKYINATQDSGWSENYLLIKNMNSIQHMDSTF